MYPILPIQNRSKNKVDAFYLLKVPQTTEVVQGLRLHHASSMTGSVVDGFKVPVPGRLLVLCFHVGQPYHDMPVSCMRRNGVTFWTEP